MEKSVLKYAKLRIVRKITTSPYSYQKEYGLYIQKEVKIMNKYESVIIISSKVEEKGLEDIKTKFTNLINNDGKVESVEDLGRKKLAYEIKGNAEGNYVLFNFEANPDFIKELERIYRITDEVIKFIVVRKED